MDSKNEIQTQKDSPMSTLSQKGGKEFYNIYNKSYRLSAAVFMIANIIDQDENLKTQVKKLSLSLVSAAVQLKDIIFSDTQKKVGDIEKISLELMSLLNIASVAGFITEMNASILKEEFESFLKELGIFSQNFERNRNVSVKNIFEDSSIALPTISSNISSRAINAPYTTNDYSPQGVETTSSSKEEAGDESFVSATHNSKNNGNGLKTHKRKFVRKETIYEFIKGHNNASIKDIVPNIVGCSEKTVQRELIALIQEGRIRKAGERRWSRYSII